MNLFLDTISSLGNILLFDNELQVVDNFSWGVKGIEISSIVPSVDAVIKKNNLDYPQLENIFVVNGPGSFTGIRATVLYVNALNMMIHKNLIPLSYFDLFDTYPIVKASSRSDAFFKLSKESEIQVLSNAEIENILKQHNIQAVYGEIAQTALPEIKIFDKVDYVYIIKKMYASYPDMGSIAKRKIEPLYLKKPTIY